MDQTPYIGPQELAALTGLSRAAIYSALERSEIPATRIGRRFLIRAADVKQRFGASDEDIAKAREQAKADAAARKARRATP